MKDPDIAVVIVVVLVALGLALLVRVVRQYQLGVLFRGISSPVPASGAAHG